MKNFNKKREQRLFVVHTAAPYAQVPYILRDILWREQPFFKITDLFVGIGDYRFGCVSPQQGVNNSRVRLIFAFLPFESFNKSVNFALIAVGAGMLMNALKGRPEGRSAIRGKSPTRSYFVKNDMSNVRFCRFTAQTIICSATFAPIFLHFRFHIFIVSLWCMDKTVQTLLNSPLIPSVH